MEFSPDENEVVGSSPLNQQDQLDDSIVSALPGESDRKFLNSLSVRKKRRDRRRLQELLEAGEDVDDVVDAAEAEASTSAAPLLVSAAEAASPAELEEGEAAQPPPPPAEFGSGDTVAAQQTAAELVQDQIDALPSMVAHMEGRRSERQNLQYRMRTIAVKLPARKRARQSIEKFHTSLSDVFANAFDMFTLGLYRSSFRSIEGKFGAGCASYFSFIRWLFVFNLALSCIVFGGCVFPYLIVRNDLNFEATMPAEILLDDPVAAATQPDMRLAVRCSRLVHDRAANLSQQTALAAVTDLFTGGGWMLTVPIFLGSYFNKSEAAFENSTDLESVVYKGHFNTPVAMLIMLIGLIACGVGAALSTSNSLYRKILKASSSSGSSRSASKLSAELFTAWDCGLRAEKAARLRRRTIAMRLHSVVLHLQLKARSRSAATLVARALANLATVGLFCAAAYLIYFAIESQSRLNRYFSNSRDLSAPLRLLIDLMPQLTISLINVAVPLVLGKLIIFEYYSASVEILVQLGRVVFLKLLSFATLIITTGSVTYVLQDSGHRCLICLLVTPALDALRWALSVKVGGRVCSKVPQSELLISNEVLGLVYRQSVCFIGAFFCPVILPIACLSYGLLFQVKRFTLRFVRVSNKSFRASRLERFFLDVLLLFLFVLLMPLTICVLHFHPSRGCGPFRVHQTPSDYHMANTLTNWVMWSNSDFAKLVYTYTVLNQTTHLLTLLLLLVFTYFFYSVIKARDTLIAFLERKLQSESRIKLELANRELQLQKMGH
uniref:TMC domain-containing protein n=1 Tax=Macrostomum lignano TaxID=282301 RepID=A0A1I8JFE3_9PLAT